MTLNRPGIVSALFLLGGPCCQREVTVDLLNARVIEADGVPEIPPTPAPSHGADASSPTSMHVAPEVLAPPSNGPFDGPGDLPPVAVEADAGQRTDAAPSPSQPESMDAGVVPLAPEAGPSEPTDLLGSSSLIHHYDFEGEGVVVYDRVGEAHGELLGGAVLDEIGGAVLDGLDDYVELPSGLISGLSEATLVAWVEWEGGDCWQRIFDFGSIVTGEGAETYAGTSVFLTPASCPWAHFGSVSDALVSAEFHVGGSVYFAQGETFPTAVPTFAALVVDPLRGLEIVLDGVLVSSSPAPLNLEEIQDINSWLGRSQWSVDAHLKGRYDEFMIFDVALSVAQLEALYIESQPGGNRTAAVRQADAQ